VLGSLLPYTAAFFKRVNISKTAFCTLSLLRQKLATSLYAKNNENRFSYKFLAETLIIYIRKNLKYLNCLVQLVLVALFCAEHSPTSCVEASHPNMTASMTGEPGGRGRARARFLSQPEVMVTMLAELATSMS
jgi:hypothetical protein